MAGELQGLKANLTLQSHTNWWMISLTVLHSKVEEGGGLAWESGIWDLVYFWPWGRSFITWEKWPHQWFWNGVAHQSSEMFVENTDSWALSNIHWFIISMRRCPGIYTFIKLPKKFYEGSSVLGHWPMLGNHWIRWSPELISILIFFWFCNHTWSFINMPKWRFNKDWFTSWSKLPELINVS